MKKRKWIASTAIALTLLTTSLAALLGQQAPKPSAQTVAQSQEALEQNDHAKALRLIQDALTRFPNDEDLRLQLARIHVYQGHDVQALDLIKTILAENPTSRGAKLELAQVYGYRRDYLQSDRLY